MADIVPAESGDQPTMFETDFPADTSATQTRVVDGKVVTETDLDSIQPAYEAGAAAAAPPRGHARQPSVYTNVADMFNKLFSTEAGNAEWDLQKHLERIKKVLSAEGYERRGLGVSWEDLCVDVTTGMDDSMPTVRTTFLGMIGLRKNGTKTKRILNNVSGYCKPGEMVLVLGAPGAGCSTLLRTIAGMLPKGLDVNEGSVFYNGAPELPNRERVIRRVSDLDIHLPNLTVEQTFRLALEFNLPLDHPRREDFIQSAVNNVLHVLGLHKQRFTVVGDESLRGVSGGEKKRVTIGEMLISNSSLLVLDDYSKGLDASAALDIAKTLKIACRALGVSVIATQYQASQGIYNEFDKILVLHEGQQLFFGSPVDAVPHFASLGIEIPPQRTIPDFLSSLAAQDESETGRSPQELAKGFRGTALEKDMKRTIPTVIAPAVKNCKAYKEAAKKPYALNTWAQIKLFLGRERNLLATTMAESKARLGRFLMFSLILGLSFLGLDEDADSLTLRSGLVFFAVIFLGFGSFGTLANVYKRRAVLYKYRDAHFSNTVSFVSASLLVELPFTICESGLLVIPMYFLSGLNDDDSYTRLLYLWLISWSLDFVMVIFILMIACLSSELSLGQAASSGILILFVLFCGFLVPSGEIPAYFIWIHYLAPIKYAYEAALINEFVGLTFDLGPGVTLDGEQYLNDSFDIDYSDPLIFRWYAVLILAAFGAFYTLLAILGLKNLTYESSGSQILYSHQKKKNEALRRLRQKARAARTSIDNIIHHKRNSVDDVALDVTQPDRQKAYFTWSGLNYDVPLPKERRGDPVRTKRLLDGVNGFVQPGSLLALMGSSGAGKTTLLDVLARRKTGGTIEGKVRVNGADQDQLFQRLSGYVEQMDIHAPRSTIREALTFSATLRLPEGTPRSKIKEIVAETAETLNLTDLLDAVIGAPDLSTSLPVEVKKRVTIGVELVSQPQILFLDEPTSGLDTIGALAVVEALRKIADTGRSLVVTIHQPASELFNSFDSLLLMQRGGQTVYFGPLGHQAEILLSYFQRHGAPPLQPGENPADYMLEQIGAGIGKSSAENWAVLWNDSEEKKALTDLVKSQSLLPPGTQPFHFAKQVPRSSQTQLSTLLHRQFRTFWRNPSYSLIRQLFALGIGLFLGLTFLQLDADQSGARSRITSLYFTAILGAVNILNAMPPMISERQIYNRERAAGMYTSVPYWSASFLVELPFIVLTALLFANTFYWLVGLQSQRFLYFILMYLAFSAFTVTYGQAVAVICPSLYVAQIVAPALMSLWNLFSGFLITKNDIPPYFIWLYYINPYTYTLEGMVVNELEGLEFSGAIPGSSLTFANGDELVDSLDMDIDAKWRDFGLVVMFAFFFRLVTLFSLTYQRHGTR